MLDQLIQITRDLHQSMYPHARVIFLAGSIVRGEGTAYSDLDIVVVCDKLPHAYRESFHYCGFPVEAFVHDPETLNYFFWESDRPSGMPSLAHMVAEGIEVPEPSEFSTPLKRLAQSVIDAGPPALSEEEVCKMRYSITNLIDDIRQPRSQEELVATGTQLYQAVADFYLRTNNLWSAKGKAIPRILARADAALCSEFCVAFDQLFAQGNPAPVVALTEALLKPQGGLLFDGHRLDAPVTYRKPLT